VILSFFETKEADEKNELQLYIPRSIIVKKVVDYLKEENFDNPVEDSLYNGVEK
jgi:hypothetical protein